MCVNIRMHIMCTIYIKYMQTMFGVIEYGLLMAFNILLASRGSRHHLQLENLPHNHNNNYPKTTHRSYHLGRGGR